MLQSSLRFNVFGTKFSLTNLETSTKYLSSTPPTTTGYISFPSTGVVAKAYNDKRLRDTLNNSLITFTDGKITEFYAWWKGQKNLVNVSGYDLLEKLLNTEKTHFFYGLSNKQLKLLKVKINTEHPNSNVLGYKSPPFVSLEDIKNNSQIAKDIVEINQLKPDFIWIGISSPKQDYLMKYFVNKLDQGIMVGVGAVLLYKAGIVKKGPQWIKNIGLRWLVRLIQEPISSLKKGRLQGLVLFLYLIVKHDICKVKINR